jgi:hypothetical protein
METFHVKSRIIVGMQYDKALQQLSVEFRNGERRLFTGVPRKIVRDMAKAASPGEFYISKVRTQFQQLAA